MAAPTVYEGVPTAQSESGALFQGKKFWFSRKIPQRSWLVENLKANGGHVVECESQADILLVDHMRKDAPPGTYSYKYVESSIRNGRLEDLNDHAVDGTSRASRPVGSTVIARKSRRMPFTEEDDQFLWNWVKPFEEAGGATGGNAIYQELETANPRHTYQSWRDRWIKFVSHQNKKTRNLPEQCKAAQAIQRDQREHQPTASKTRQIQESEVEQLANEAQGSGAERQGPQAGEKSPGSTVLPRSAEKSTPQKPMSDEEILNILNGDPESPSAEGKIFRPSSKRGKNPFTVKEGRVLLSAAAHIINTRDDHIDDAWQRMAEEWLTHSAEDWRAFFEETIKPIYEGQLKRKERQARHPSEQSPSTSNILTSPIVDIVGSGREQVDRAVQTSSPAPPSPQHHETLSQLKYPQVSRQRSPSFPPESPASPTPYRQRSSPLQLISSVLADSPGPSDVSERSSIKNFLEVSRDGLLPHVDGTQNSAVDKLSQKRKRLPWDSDSGGDRAPSVGSQDRLKRRRQTMGASRPSEMPSAPEHDSITQPDDPERPEKSSPVSFYSPDQSVISSLGSPLVLPQGGASFNSHSASPEDEELDFDLPSPSLHPLQNQDRSSSRSTPPQPRPQEAEGQNKTSPLAIRLVSDHEQPEPSPFSQPKETRHTGSPTPDFETAPDFPPVYETAREGTTNGGESTTLSDAQALFQGYIAHELREEDYLLPQPDEIAQTPQQHTSPSSGKAFQDTFSDDDSATSLSDTELSLPSSPASSNAAGRAHVTRWLDRHHSVPMPTLIRAFKATIINYRLADRVLVSLLAGAGIPDGVKGIWTEEDDDDVTSGEPERIDRVEEKQGRGSAVRRLDFLEGLA